MKPLAKLRKSYRRDFLNWELGFSLAATLTFVLASEFWFGRSVIAEWKDGRQAMYGATAGLGVSCVGFLISATAVILAFGDMPKLRLLRDSGQYQRIFTIYFSAMKWMSVLTVVAFAGLLVDTDSRPVVWMTYLLVCSGSIAAFRLYRCVWILKKLSKVAINFQCQADPPLYRTAG